MATRVSSSLISSLFFLLMIILTLIIITIIPHHGTNAQQNFIKFVCGDNTTNNTTNSTYQTNLQALLLNISHNTQIKYGFYDFSLGENNDKVNVIALCQGDLSLQDCQGCISDSRVLLPQVCPNTTEAIGWYPNCFLRYSDRSISGIMQTSPTVYLWSTRYASQKDQFNYVLNELMSSLRVTAASGNSTRKFAEASTIGPSNQTIYGMAQCTPDLSFHDCNVCLNDTITNGIPSCCDGQTGGRVGTPSCSVRYETYNFFQSGGAPQLQLPQPPSPPYTEGKSNISRIAIAIVLPFASIAALIFIIVVIYLKSKVELKNINETEAKEVVDSLQMDFETIREATNDFSEANKLGQGGFGAVYLGRLYNGQEIAVKRLSREFGQGDMEFKNEVILMAKLQHRNLVKLLGFSIKDTERLLVYEFVPNKSLDYFIFDRRRAKELNWEKRYKIIEGIARGLLYLHQDSRVRIIHRDLKASNILLDEEMNAKISDFGISRLFVIDQTQGRTNNIVGTYGYMAPEYVKLGTFSMKSDIFSFGVLVLELISGKRNSEYVDRENMEHIGSAVWKSWRNGTLSSMIDPLLLIEEGGSTRSEILRSMQIGLLCVQEKASDRPPMDTIVAMLNAYSFSLPIPLQPSFYFCGSGLPTDIIIRSSSRNELSFSEQYPR